MKTTHKTIDGNEACALNSYLFTELASIYPITPSSTMAECVDRWSSEGKKIYSEILSKLSRCNQKQVQRECFMDL